MSNRSRIAGLALIGICLLVGATTASRLVGATADSPVADAAMRGDTEGVRTLLRGGADVNAAQGDGMTALHWAALNGDLKTMNVLLYAGAATEPLTRVGALHAAAPRQLARARARWSRVCSKPAARPGPFTATGVQPLHLAAQAGNARAVTALLDRGADINAQGQDARPHAARLRGVAESARRDEGAARAGRRRPPGDDGHRLPGARRRRHSGAADARPHRLGDDRTQRSIRTSIPIRRRRARAAPGQGVAAAEARGGPDRSERRGAQGGTRRRRPAAAVGHRADRQAGRLHRAALRRARRVRRRGASRSSTPA